MRQLAIHTALAVGVAALWAGSAWGQVRTNFALLDSLTRSAVEQLPLPSNCDSVAIIPPESPARWLIAEKLLQRGIRVREVSACTVAIAECGIRYAAHAQRELVVRRAAVELRLIAADTTARATAVELDTIARDQLLEVEMPRSELTTAAVPPPPRSLWDEILEPVLIVATAATTLLLLFTARTR